MLTRSHSSIHSLYLHKISTFWLHSIQSGQIKKEEHEGKGCCFTYISIGSVKAARKEKKRLITDGFDSDKETLVMLKDVSLFLF